MPTKPHSSSSPPCSSASARGGAELRLALSDVAFTTLSHLGVLAEAELLQQDRPSLGNDPNGALGRDFGTVDGDRIMVRRAHAGAGRSGADRAQGCAGAVTTVTELLPADARVSQTNPVFERMDTLGIRTHLAAGETVRAEQVSRQPTSPAPLLGTHTDEVLYEVLGLDSVAVGRLHNLGVVAGLEQDAAAPPIRRRHVVDA